MIDLYKGRIISEIETLHGTFTKSEQKIKHYLRTNLVDIIHLSVTEFAENVSISETTIVRFCQKLGYKGYHDFKLAIAQDETLRKQLPHNNDALVSEQIFSNIQAVLQDSKNLVNQELIKNSVKLIDDAKNVFFYGVGGSGITALEAHSKFFRISTKFHALTDSHFQMMSAQIMTSDDLLIVFTLSGSTKDILDAVQQAKIHGVKVIAVTNFKKSPITKYSDIVLLTSGKSDALNGGDRKSVV